MRKEVEPKWPMAREAVEPAPQGLTNGMPVSFSLPIGPCLDGESQHREVKRRRENDDGIFLLTVCVYILNTVSRLFPVPKKRDSVWRGRCASGDTRRYVALEV